MSLQTCTCDLGYFWVDADATCHPCPVGSFGYESTEMQGISLQGDSIFQATGGACASCPNNTFTRHNGTKSARDCIPCGADSFSAYPGARCLCNAGFAATVLDGPCFACAARTYKSWRSTDQEPLSQCLACPLNSTSGTGSTRCWCPADTYGSILRNLTRADCVPCPPHSVSAPDSADIADCKCAAGFYGLPSPLSSPVPSARYA
jgi:hypothetical protein